MSADKTDSACFQREKVSRTKPDLLSMEGAVFWNFSDWLCSNWCIFQRAVIKLFSREHLLNYSAKASTFMKFPHCVTTIMGNRFISTSYSKRHFLCWTHFNPIFVTSYLSLIPCSPPKKNKIPFRLQELLPMLPNHISTVGRGRGALLVHFMC